VTTHADLLLINTRVLTLEPAQPDATAVAVRGETIAAVGSHSDLTHLRGPQTRTIDCQGMTLLPGLVDAHCHLLALAASWQGLDCRPPTIGSIEQLQAVVQSRATATPLGHWVRGFGYDDLALVDRRHPTRWDLDQAASQHPVRLDHRSGHAMVLNSRALELAGIYQDTPDPVDGVIERNGATGEPTGVLLELAGFLRQRLGQQWDKAGFEEGIQRLNRELLQYGITSVHDAGPGNDLARWETFQGLKASGRLACRVTMLAGVSHLAEFRAAGWNYGDGDDGLRLGQAKAMLTMTTGALHPDAAELAEMVAEAQHRGFPVAVHAVEREAVAAAAQALQTVPEAHWRKAFDPPGPKGEPSLVPPLGNGRLGGILLRNRIEHCAECPPELVTQVRRCGATVVTQPGFIYWNGDRYREHVAPSLLPHLYPIGTLARVGAPLAFGSDAPVIDPDPWPAIASAVTRATRSGGMLSVTSPRGPDVSGHRKRAYPDQGVSVASALRMYTLGGAFAEGSQLRKGSIRPGKLADLVLVDSDPTRVEPSRIKNIRVVLTVLGGRVVWNDPL